MTTGSELRALRRAIDHASNQRYGSARECAVEATRRGGRSGLVSMAAAMIRFVCRDHHEALEHLDVAAARSDRAASRAFQLQMSFAGSLGWDQDARAAIDAACDRFPRNAAWQAHAVRLHAAARSHELALEHCERAVQLEPRSARMWMELAGLAARTEGAKPQRASAATRRALELAPGDVNYQREAARVAIDLGQWNTARAMLEELGQASDPEAVAFGRAWLAELALWSDAPDLPQRMAKLREHGPGGGAHSRLEGAALARQGRHLEALGPLDDALACDPEDYLAHVWRAECTLRLGRFEETHAHLTRASMAAPGFLAVAWMLRFLAVVYEEAFVCETVEAHRTEEFRETVLELCPEHADVFPSGPESGVRDAVEAALAALGGNRSIYPAHAQGARLRTRSGCRHASRHALQLIKVLSPDALMAAFEPIIDAYPGSSLPLAHRGEAKLWLGDVVGARADLEESIAINRGTRWAWIGLSGAALTQGDPEHALDLMAKGIETMGNTTGPAVFGYRGEAYRRLGRLVEARTDLERSVDLHASRAGSVVSLALCYWQLGEEDRFRRLVSRLRDQATGLLSDAARESGVEFWGDSAPADADVVRVLERALEMMGGNRSSTCVTYRTGAGALRFVPQYPHRGSAPHQRDDAILRQCMGMLRAVAGSLERGTNVSSD